MGMARLSRVVALCIGVPVASILCPRFHRLAVKTWERTERVWMMLFALLISAAASWHRRSCPPEASRSSTHRSSPCFTSLCANTPASSHTYRIRTSSPRLPQPVATSANPQARGHCSKPSSPWPLRKTLKPVAKPLSPWPPQQTLKPVATSANPQACCQRSYVHLQLTFLCSTTQTPSCYL